MKLHSEKFSRHAAKIITVIFLFLATFLVYQEVATIDEDIYKPMIVQYDLTIKPHDDNHHSHDEKKVKKEPSLVRQQIDKERYWQFQVGDGGNTFDCQISTTPTIIQQSSNAEDEENDDDDSEENDSSRRLSSSSHNTANDDHGFDQKKEQYVIHIHGLHHTGTGYLRQTLHDALNDAFDQDSASMQDSLRPYQQLFQQAKDARNKTRYYELSRQYRVPENEGHHLQNVYPRFVDRWKVMRESGEKVGVRNGNKMAYLADYCVADTTAINSNDSNDDDAAISKAEQKQRNHQIGTILHQQWSQYWDMNAKFLIQKTPTLDVVFLECAKVLPTLHVIIVRHPMTSNAWHKSYMGQLWTAMYTHVFEALANDEVEWYAVVTYEALLQYHDVVVQELLEVVQSGMRRYKDQSGKGRHLRETQTNNDAEPVQSREVDVNMNSKWQSSHHRRLPLKKSNIKHEENNQQEASAKYLIPKETSVEVWQACLLKKRCQKLLKQLTEDVLKPFFGYISVSKQGTKNNLSLFTSPSPVIVTKHAGHVMFTSEADAVNELRRSRHGEGAADEKFHPIESKPSFKLLSRMKMLI